jgi:hypothetical protein
MSEGPDDPETVRHLQEALDRMSPDELLDVRDYLIEESGGQPPARPPRSTKIPTWMLVAGAIASVVIFGLCLVGAISRR